MASCPRGSAAAAATRTGWTNQWPSSGWSACAVRAPHDPSVRGAARTTVASRSAASRPGSARGAREASSTSSARRSRDGELAEPSLQAAVGADRGHPLGRSSGSARAAPGRSARSSRAGSTWCCRQWLGAHRVRHRAQGAEGGVDRARRSARRRRRHRRWRRAPAEHDGRTASSISASVSSPSTAREVAGELGPRLVLACR